MAHRSFSSTIDGPGMRTKQLSLIWILEGQCGRSSPSRSLQIMKLFKIHGILHNLEGWQEMEDFCGVSVRSTLCTKKWNVRVLYI